MPLRPSSPCSQPGCPQLQPCPFHPKRHSQHILSRQERGYDVFHDRQRREWQPLVESGTVLCARCGRLILPGERWDLGHSDDRASWTGPEHSYCNRSYRRSA